MAKRLGNGPLLLFLSIAALQMRRGEALGSNWGTQSSHPLPADIVVRLLKDNGFDKVKLFEADPFALQALGRSNIQVMIGIPNELLAPLAASVRAAEQWVLQNVSKYISKNGVDIRYVAVGNEPFLKTYMGMFQQTTFLALQNIQAALIKAGLGRQVKATIPLNADVYQSSNGLPSGGDFRHDIHDVMLSIIRFLRDNASPLTINIYPFLSLYADPHFPVDYAFFNGAAKPLVDGPITYTNVFDANYDTLIWALERNGFSDMPVIVGEIGWPTDGDPNANLDNARRFNQGLLDRIAKRMGTPKRPAPPDIYVFALIDEDAKSVQPGNFERHWGLFYYDGSVKYPLVLADGSSLVPAKGVRYMEPQWCVMSREASLTDPQLEGSVAYACEYADCTSLGRGSSCGDLDARGNVSYAMNQFYQTADQQKGACEFGNLSVITRSDPSQGACRFEIMIDVGRHDKSVNSSAGDAVGAVRGVAAAVAAVAVVMWSGS
ncbi:glucan endo-1,3-beta-glucosidase 5-like [Phalaenopsis equestris]|uniref:glucan endo-1,3-beta-glucosidase 5-like n=1 Tax=Phalaenopsis equestris TaxID=78828 RepID=UPI0009E1FE10|nr:glucan endo-1,3-beta-glucosidase 5-like [Phalaenopsis equestris]